jgi:putative sugar O-methyltransferase
MKRMFAEFYQDEKQPENKNNMITTNYTESIANRIQSYKDVCREAVLTNETFESFKKDSRYCAVLEHVSFEQGVAYIDEIFKLCPDMFHSHVLSRMLRNDRQGHPSVFEFQNPVSKTSFTASPTTLRYMKVVSDLTHYFGKPVLNDAHVVEIGPGYGGLNIVLQHWARIDHYWGIDLMEPRNLASKYVKYFNAIEAKTTFLTTEQIDEAISNLKRLQGKTVVGISNYAFSECDRDVRSNYIRNVFRYCHYGYLTINYLNDVEVQEIEDLLTCECKNTRTIRRLAEIPSTGDRNIILIWFPSHTVEWNDETRIQHALRTSQSQIGQDRFVLEVLGTQATCFACVTKEEAKEAKAKETKETKDEIKVHLQRRCYLDIGGHAPIHYSNTYILEQLGWKGIAFDIDPKYKVQHDEERVNPMIIADVTKIDWPVVLDQHNMPSVIDYLSMDVDEATCLTMQRFPFHKYKFRVLSVEHDRYRFGDAIANTIRTILIQNGYEMIVKDICLQGNPFEDWWVHPLLVDGVPKLKNRLSATYIDHAKIFAPKEKKPNVLFLIGSTIQTDNTKPLNYSAVRSVFSAEERFQQTLFSIESIRLRLPHAVIFVADNSETLPENYLVTLKNKADYVYRCYSQATTSSLYKGQGESECLQSALKEIERLQLSYDYLFKLSGRYYLTETFDLQSYLVAPDKVAFFKPPHHDVVSTVLYCIPKTMIKTYLNWLSQVGTADAMERYMWKFSKDCVIYVLQQGAEGRIAVDGALVRY